MSAVAPANQRNLRACLQCKLVKNQADFKELGCENCPDLDMQDDLNRVITFTTPNFEGFVHVYSFILVI